MPNPFNFRRHWDENNVEFVTWNTVNGPKTGKALQELPDGVLVETEESKCVFLSKYKTPNK